MDLSNNKEQSPATPAIPHTPQPISLISQTGARLDQILEVDAGITLAGLLEQIPKDDLMRQVNFHHAGLINFLTQDTTIDEIVNHLTLRPSSATSDSDLHDLFVFLFTIDPLSTKILYNLETYLPRLFSFTSASTPLPKTLLTVLESLIRHPNGHLLVKALSTSSSILAGLSLQLHHEPINSFLQALLKVPIPPDPISLARAGGPPIIICDLPRQLYPILLAQILSPDMEDTPESDIFANTIETLAKTIDASDDATEDLISPPSIRLICLKILAGNCKHDSTIIKSTPFLLRLLLALSSDDPRNANLSDFQETVIVVDERKITRNKNPPSALFEMMCCLDWLRNSLSPSPSDVHNIDLEVDVDDSRTIKRLGNLRLALTKIVGGFLRCRYQPVDKLLFDNGIITQIFDLFFEFERCSILQCLILEAIIKEIFCNEAHIWLLVSLLSKNKEKKKEDESEHLNVLDRICKALSLAEAARRNSVESEETLEMVPENIAHLMAFAEVIRGSPIAKKIAEKNAEWNILYPRYKAFAIFNLFDEW